MRAYRLKNDDIVIDVHRLKPDDVNIKCIKVWCSRQRIHCFNTIMRTTKDLARKLTSVESASIYSQLSVAINKGQSTKPPLLEQLGTEIRERRTLPPTRTNWLHNFCKRVRA